MRVNLIEDWTRLVEQDLRHTGLDTTELSDENIGIAYCTMQLREVDPVPRRFYASRVLLVPPEVANGYADLVRKVIAGESLRPNMSTTLRFADFEDLLFSDWGINHYHLGDRVEANGFVNRTGPVLFAMHTGDSFYAIQILPHGRGHQHVWTTKDLLRIVHDDWPELIAHARLPVLDIRPEYSEADHYELRRAGVMISVKVADGAIYCPPGGGITTAGIGAAVSDLYSHWLTTLRDIEASARATEQRFMAEVGVRLGGREPQVRLQRGPTPGSFHVVETVTGETMFEIS